MDKPIAKGDLVMVVRACPYCGGAEDVGYVFTAGWIGYCDGIADCCKERGVDAPNGISVNNSNKANEGYPLYMLKRLDPGALNEDVPTEEKVDA